MFQRVPPTIIAALACGLLFLLGGHLRAVQVYGTSGTSSTYTTAPSDDFGFANVAQVWDTADGFYASGVYLGNGWMLSAYHVVRNGSGGFSFGNVLLDGSNYSVNASTAVRITDPVTHNPADMALFQLATVPTDSKLKTLAISGTMPDANAGLILMGNGLNRAVTLTNWNVDTSPTPWTWTVTSGVGDVSGYYYGSGQSLRWGNGTLSGTDAGSDGFGVVSFVYSTFDQTDGSSIVAFGDSGGGIFCKRGTTWELCGILLALGTYSGQPGNTSVVGDATYGADLSVYRDQINSVAGVPTISTVPSAQTILAGQSATFSVAATGFGTLTYQWYKNGVAIAGATSSSYTIPATSAGDAANYTVTVTSSYGTTTSGAYTLTVSNPVSAMPPWALAALTLLLFCTAAPRLQQEKGGVFFTGPRQ